MFRQPKIHTLPQAEEELAQQDYRVAGRYAGVGILYSNIL